MCQHHPTLVADSMCLFMQLYDEMGSRHRVRPPLINIIKTATVPDAQCKRDNTKQFHETVDEEAGTKTGVKFPLTRKMVRYGSVASCISMATTCHQTASDAITTAAGRELMIPARSC